MSDQLQRESEATDWRAPSGGKYLAFRLEQSTYAVEIGAVREIIFPLPITRVTKTRNYISGVINLRGKVIPVMDMRTRLGMGMIESTDQTVIIVAESELQGVESATGLLVDEVLDVLTLAEDQIEPSPNLGPDAKGSEFLCGVGRTEAAVFFLMNADRVISLDDDRVGIGSEFNSTE